MNPPSESSLPSNIRPIRGEQLLRRLHRLLPLGRKYAPLFAALNSRHALVAIPFGPFRVVYPALWRKAAVSQLLLGTDLIPEFNLLVPICRQLKHGHLIDVGANIGLYTLLLRSISELPIIAYEPQPFLCRLFAWSVAFNQLKDVEVRNLGCGAARGELPFLSGPNGGVLATTAEAPAAATSGAGSGGGDWEQEAKASLEDRPVIRVPITTLDESLQNVPRVALLKIDCEGFEYHILRGAMKVIERHGPQLFLEIHPTILPAFGHSVEQVLELLNPHYELEFWCFQTAHGKNKLARSLAKFRRPQGIRYPDAAAMRAAVRGAQPPSQIYCIGQPRKPRR